MNILLENAIEKYPARFKCRDGTDCTIRPVGKRDEVKLQKFFLAVPEEERLFIKQPVTNRALLQEWCRHADFEQNLPILMLHGQTVIGEATLHQRNGGWKRHIGLVTVLTHPEFRGRDVAKILVDQLVGIAREVGLRRLEAEFNGERQVAIRALEDLGFQKLYCLHDYVLDMSAQTHDYVVMGMSLGTDEEYAGIG